MKLNREKFLNQLESVESGLSKREIIEQSSCFVFEDGKVMTFNDEVACSQDCDLMLKGAVPAEPLLSILRKLKEEDVVLTQEGSEVIIKGKNKRAGIQMEKDVLLPMSGIDKPNKWSSLHEDFCEFISLVEKCVSRDESKFQMTCVHITQEFLEGCDNYQITRCDIKTGVKSACLVKGTAVKNITALGMTEVSETENWIHFKNASGLIMSCRRYNEADAYPNLSSFIKFKGAKITLPKGLGDSALNAAVFACDSSESNQVVIELKPGKLRIKGTGITGWYNEMKKVTYKGPEMKFAIAPDLLVDITKRHNDCEIDEKRLKLVGTKFHYVTSLNTVG